MKRKSRCCYEVTPRLRLEQCRKTGVQLGFPGTLGTRRPLRSTAGRPSTPGGQTRVRSRGGLRGVADFPPLSSGSREGAHALFTLFRNLEPGYAVVGENKPKQTRGKIPQK